MPTGELKFTNESQLIFQQKAVSIIIQLDRPDYRHEAIRMNACLNTNSYLISFFFFIIKNFLLVRFRCIPVYPDLSAYYGTLDAFVIVRLFSLL